MKKLFLSSIAALSVLSASAAHAREWQGNMPKPIGKLPSNPPVVCVTPNWTSEPCENRQLPAHAEDWRDFLKFFDWLKWTETNWLGTVLQGGCKLAKYDGHEWNGEWPKHTTVRPPSNSFTPIPPIILLRENGGIIVDHVKRWIELAASNKDVEIRGPCYSACTLIMA